MLVRVRVRLHRKSSERMKEEALGLRKMDVWFLSRPNSLGRSLFLKKIIFLCD